MLDQWLAALSAWLGGKDYLEGRFTAGDPIMTTALRELVDCSAFRVFRPSMPIAGAAKPARRQYFGDSARN